MNEETFRHIFWLLISYGENLTIDLIGEQKYLTWCYEYDVLISCKHLAISLYFKEFDPNKFPVKSQFLIDNSRS